LYHLVAYLSYVGNCAADFDETVRTAIFLAALGRLFERKKNWSWRFVLGFWFFFAKQKEQ
jgi:hypothetical protein